MKIAFIILPNQLFKKHVYPKYQHDIYLIEDSTYFTSFPFHKQKLILHRASMKAHYDHIKSNNNVKYIEYKFTKNIYESIFSKYSDIWIYDPIDNGLLGIFEKMSKKFNNNLTIQENQLFIESNLDLQKYYDSLKNHKNYRHDNFYKWQRKRLNILVDKKGKPFYGSWSFDKMNRESFNKKYEEPSNKLLKKNKYVNEAIIYVEKHWPNNFGEISDTFYPTTYSEAKKILNIFLEKKFNTFGKFQDAVSESILFGSHSLLSSSLNIGLITVRFVIDKIMEHFNKMTEVDKKKNINNVEGFVRQLIGWRSYVRFIYKYHGDSMINENSLKNNKKMSKNWFNATTGIYPIDSLINKVKQTAYAHHIERLMFLGNFAIICGLNPKDVYRWFMICFIDSYEWVMVPNIMGMSQYSSEIKMMTRPYISSSIYLIKMSDYKLDNYDKIKLGSEEYYWNEIWNSLYYNCLNKNKNIFRKIYSLAMHVKRWENNSQEERKEKLEMAKKYLEKY
jgi:deoxyribodipyrimidine photolyase-related protein